VEAHLIKIPIEDEDVFIKTPVAVRKAENLPFRADGTEQFVGVKAMWDTGCIRSCMCCGLARYLALAPVGEMSIKSIHDSHIANIYQIDILFSDGKFLPNIRVAEITDSAHFDLIIGLDIIRLGNFHLDNVNGNTVFTFSLPFQSEGIH
jgi:hypothetical protein